MCVYGKKDRMHPMGSGRGWGSDNKGFESMNKLHTILVEFMSSILKDSQAVGETESIESDYERFVGHMKNVMLNFNFNGKYNMEQF